MAFGNLRLTLPTVVAGLLFLFPAQLPPKSPGRGWSGIGLHREHRSQAVFSEVLAFGSFLLNRSHSHADNNFRLGYLGVSFSSLYTT